jgi:hypothetical protein
MDIRGNRDLVAGSALLAFGLFFSVYALAQLKLGSFAQMGPGMFPLIIGVAVSGFGVALLGGTWLKAKRLAASVDEAPPEAADWRTLALVVLSIVAFALVIRRLGMGPAVFVLVLLASFSSNDLPPLKALMLAAALTALGWLVFVLALGLPIKLFVWPF